MKTLFSFTLFTVLLVSACNKSNVKTVSTFFKDLNTSLSDTSIYIKDFKDGEDRKIDLTGRIPFYFDTVFVMMRSSIRQAEKIEILSYSEIITKYDSLPLRCYYENQKDKVVVVRIIQKDKKLPGITFC